MLRRNAPSLTLKEPLANNVAVYALSTEPTPGTAAAEFVKDI